MVEHMIKKFPGIGCAHVSPAGDTGHEFYGFSDRENEIRVDGGTVFPACSISKFITALCVMKLSEQGIIELDRPANACLARWKLRDLSGDESDVSVRCLLWHTAGILDGEDGFYGHRMTDQDIGIMDILEGTTAYNNRPAAVERTPGAAFEYSDAGFCVLQVLLEDVSGKEFAELARELVFDKLGLKDTFFGTREHMTVFSRSGRIATGYGSDDMPIEGKYPLSPDLAASGLWTTPGELLEIAKDFLDSFHGHGRVLCQACAREMTRPPADFPWVGLGLFRQGEDVIVSKGWGENGQCMMKIDLRAASAAVVMTNKDPGAPQEESGVEQLLNTYLYH